MHAEAGKNNTGYLGWGFSNDIQTVVQYEKKSCFKGNATASDIIAKESFEYGITHRDLETAIGVNASNTKVDWGVFSKEVYADYLRRADDSVRPLQTSWHFYVYGGHEYNVTLDGTGKDALTFEGHI